MVLGAGNAICPSLLSAFQARFEPTIPTHDSHPRFSCLSRLLKYLGGRLKSLKLFRTQHNVAEKAGVGGSTPSLVTIIPRLPMSRVAQKSLAESRRALQSAFSPLFFGEIRFGS
jgi:hypothetical protein